MEELLTTAKVAEKLGLAEITVRKWRISGRGPRYVRCVGRVRYRQADIEAWVTARTVVSTSEQSK